MGQPKHLLTFGEETLLERVVRITATVLDPIVVVAAANQELPRLPDTLPIIRDDQPHKGPLYGLSGGLSVLEGQCAAAYLTACDVPFLKPAFIEFIINALNQADIAIPQEEKFYHPLAAVYRTALKQQVDELIASGHSRPFDLVQAANAITIPVQKLQQVDPQLDSLRNLNTPEEYQQALQDAGL